MGGGASLGNGVTKEVSRQPRSCYGDLNGVAATATPKLCTLSYDRRRRSILYPGWLQPSRNEQPHGSSICMQSTISSSWHRDCLNYNRVDVETGWTNTFINHSKGDHCRNRSSTELQDWKSQYPSKNPLMNALALVKYTHVLARHTIYQILRSDIVGL